MRRVEDVARHVVDGAVELEGLGRRQVPEELLLLAHHQHDLLEELGLAALRHVAVDARPRPRSGGAGRRAS